MFVQFKGTMSLRIGEMVLGGKSSAQILQADPVLYKYVWVIELLNVSQVLLSNCERC